MKVLPAKFSWLGEWYQCILQQVIYVVDSPEVRSQSAVTEHITSQSLTYVLITELTEDPWFWPEVLAPALTHFQNCARPKLTY